MSQEICLVCFISLPMVMKCQSMISLYMLHDYDIMVAVLRMKYLPHKYFLKAFFSTRLHRISNQGSHNAKCLTRSCCIINIFHNHFLNRYFGLI